MEIMHDNGNVNRERNNVLNKWKNDFAQLLNPNSNSIFDPDSINVMVNIEINIEESGLFENNFSLSEVLKSIYDLKNNRSVGIDDIPAEVLKNDNVLLFIHTLCNMCYASGKVPKMWAKSLIRPIPKCSTNEPRDPLSYRGIAITAVAYKVYCRLLNQRVTAWSENNNIIFEGQNGFRQGRIIIDHISSLTSIIETRKKTKKIYILCFYRFQKGV